MSKTNSLKKKTTGFDIFYRVVTVLLIVAIYPVFYFGNILTFEIAHTDISNLLGSLGQLISGGNTNISGGGNLETTYGSISLYKLPELLDTFTGLTNEPFDFKATILENELYRPVVVFAVLVAIALIIGLVILGFAIFSNKVKIITALSASGFFCTIAAYVSFTNFFAKDVLSGEITISQLLNIDSAILTLIIPYIGEMIVFALDGAFYGVMFLMLAVCLWSLCIMIVNSSDEKEKQMKAAAKNK